MSRIITVSSSHARRLFLDFFSSHSKIPHAIVKSSKVVSHDPTLPFVNAGMNAFKRVFLGEAKPPSCSDMSEKCAVANVQKCVRVGGKHNDLENVGPDGSHHTFFEMLGNWAFNEAYFKQESCSMAWELLTNHYKLPAEKLYVTYFQGSDFVLPDLETKEIWLSLGVKESNILPFGAKDNFWEMGATGPCGPSTEIHFDHNGIGPKFVNAGRDDLVEIWNLVFMQYNRGIDGTLELLPKCHVDTGMGLERLTAVLNRKTSNYDTDLFQKFFKVISQQTRVAEYSGSFNNDLDTAYRILADHCRMLSVCLSDGMFVDSSPKLKQVLKRAHKVAKLVFLKNHQDSSYSEGDLIMDLCEVNAEILGDTYPELKSNLNRVKIILEHETELLRSVEREAEKYWLQLVKEYPKASQLIEMSDSKRFLEALKFLDKMIGKDDTAIHGVTAFRLYDSLGLKEEEIEILATLKGLMFSREEYQRSFNDAKVKSKYNSAVKHKSISKTSGLLSLKGTDDSFKYNFSVRGETSTYEFPVVTAKIVAITGQDLSPKDFLKTGEKGIIFLDKTNFFSEAGGQIGDVGEIITESRDVFSVEDCQMVRNNLVAHIGKVKRGRISARGGLAQAKVDPENRLRLMQAHTCTHILNGILHSVLPLTCQKSSLVEPGEFKFDFAVFRRDNFGPEMVSIIEEKVNQCISAKLPVERKILQSSQDLEKFESVHFEPQKTESDSAIELVPKFITIPGEVYPDDSVSIIFTPVSVEPCCGTHVSNTGHIQGFVITNVKSPHTGVRSLRCVVGTETIKIREKGIDVIDTFTELKEEIDNLPNYSQPERLRRVDQVRRKSARLEKNLKDSNFKIPYYVRNHLMSLINRLNQDINLKNKSYALIRMEEEFSMKIVESESQPFVIHRFFEDNHEAKVNLSKITRLCQDKPVLVVVNQMGNLTAQACVPENLSGESFNAFAWLEDFGRFMDAKPHRLKNKSQLLVANLKSSEIPSLDTLTKAMESAEQFALKAFDTLSSTKIKP